MPKEFPVTNSDNVPSRRSILAGLVAAPIVPIVATAATAAPDRTAWDSALRAANEARTAAFSLPATHDDNLVERVANAYADRIDELLEVPAPDMEAALDKLEIFIERDTLSSFSPRMLRMIAADIRRLSLAS